MTVAEAVTLIAAVTASIVSILGAILAFVNATKVAQVHTLVNGMSERNQQLSMKAGNATGRAELMTEQKAESDIAAAVVIPTGAPIPPTVVK